MFPFEIKQVHLPSQLLPFDEKIQFSVSTARARLRALARSYLNA